MLLEYFIDIQSTVSIIPIFRLSWQVKKSFCIIKTINFVHSCEEKLKIYFSFLCQNLIEYTDFFGFSAKLPTKKHAISIYENTNSWFSFYWLTWLNRRNAHEREHTTKVRWDEAHHVQCVGYWQCDNAYVFEELNALTRREMKTKGNPKHVAVVQHNGQDIDNN